VELEESPLALTKIESSLEYKLEREASIASALSLYILLPFTSLPLSLSSISACCFIFSYAFSNAAPASSHIFFILSPNSYHKLHSACIFTTSKLIFTK